MKSYKRVTAIVLSVVTAASLLAPQISTRAEEPTQQYVVLAKNEKGYDKVDQLCGDRAVEVTEEFTEKLVDNHVVVAQMTETEATRLEKDKNIMLVEEDIPLDASLAVEEVNVNSSVSSSDMLNENQNIMEETETVSGNMHPEKEYKDEDMTVLQWNMDAIHVVNRTERTQVLI